MADLPNYAFFEGEIVPYGQAKVSVLTHALNYGTAAFGGIRAYWNENEKQLYLFRPFDHYRRFLNSTKLLRMNLGQTIESLTEITKKLLQTENYHCDVYIRPLAYKADEGIGVKLHGLKDALSIVSFPYTKMIANDTNGHIMISSWRRVDDNMIPARGKISGAYANSAAAKSDAILAGFDEAVVLNQDGHISEGSAMNFFIVRDGVLITPPSTENILEGITRRTVMELAQQALNIPVVERMIDRTEVYLADEAFLTGTAAQISAATRVDHRPIGTGEMGPVVTQLRILFDDAVRGKLPQFQHWLIPVY